MPEMQPIGDDPGMPLPRTGPIEPELPPIVNGQLSTRKSAHLDTIGEGGKEAGVREGLPAGYRMRADSHYVEQLDVRTPSAPIRLIDVHAIETGLSHADPPSAAFIESIKRHGVLQPLLIENRSGKYRVIAGRRRLTAAIAAGLRDVPCLVHHVDPAQAEQLALASNLPATRKVSPSLDASLQVADAAAQELGNALSSLASCANLLSTSSAMTQAVAADLIRAEAARAMDLLVAMRVMRSETPIARTRVSVRALVERVSRSTSPERRLKGTIVDIKPVADALSIRGDEHLLSGAVAGLLGATAALIDSIAGARIEISAVARGDASVAIAVSQAAVDVPAAWLARAFESPLPIKSSVGVLVWLQSAQKVARAHGGDVLADADEHGTSLTMALPAME